jgi:hypothetical protein
MSGYALTIERKYGPAIIRVAAKHNLREIAAEIGADSHIDAARIRDNFSLRGPDTAAGVVREAKALLDAAGVVKLRKNAVTALELMFTLPARTNVALREYFENATRWAERHFGVPVLSSVVHLDEGAPHCHVLMLPLVNGKMNGSDLHGGRSKLSTMQASFHEEVGATYGFVRQVPKKRIGAAARASAMALLREHFKTRFAMTDGEIDVVLKPHAKDPDSLLLGLSIAIPPPRPRGKTFVDIMTTPCKPEPLNPIGKANRKPRGIVEIENPMDSYPYTCVGKGFATLSNSIDSPHRQAVPETSTSSQQAVPSTTTTDSTPPLNRAYGSQHVTLVSTSFASDKVAYGMLATPKMPEKSTTPIRASDQPTNVNRIDIPSDAKCLASEFGTRQAKRPPACNSHKSAMVEARPVNIVNEKPMRLHPVVAVSRNGQLAPPRHPKTAPRRATIPKPHRALMLGLRPGDPTRRRIAIPMTAMCVYPPATIWPSAGTSIVRGLSTANKSLTTAHSVGVVAAALNHMQPTSPTANYQHYEFSPSNLLSSGSNVTGSARTIAPAYAKALRGRQQG